MTNEKDCFHQEILEKNELIQILIDKLHNKDDIISELKTIIKKFKDQKD